MTPRATPVVTPELAEKIVLDPEHLGLAPADLHDARLPAVLPQLCSVWLGVVRDLEEQHSTFREHEPARPLADAPRVLLKGLGRDEPIDPGAMLWEGCIQVRGLCRFKL